MNRELLVDPKGESACSTRRRMAWAIWLSGVLFVGTALVLAAGGADSDVLSAAVWAGTAMVIGGPLMYYLGRAALERVLSSVTKMNIGTG